MKKWSGGLKRAGVMLLAVCFLSGCANYVEDGTKLLEKKEYTQAVDAFEKAVQQASDKKTVEPEAYRGLGIAYFEQKEYEKAQENLQKALDTGAKETPVIYNMIGISAMQQEDYESALAAFEAGITLEMVVAEGEKEVDYTETIREMRFNRIICCEQVQDWENAKTAANEYMEDYPDDAEVQREVEFLETR